MKPKMPGCCAEIETIAGRGVVSRDEENVQQSEFDWQGAVIHPCTRLRLL